MLAGADQAPSERRHNHAGIATVRPARVNQSASWEWSRPMLAKTRPRRNEFRAQSARTKIFVQIFCHGWATTWSDFVKEMRIGALTNSEIHSIVYR